MTIARRALLRSGIGLASASVALGAAPFAFADSAARSLAFDNLHTGESLDVTYWHDGDYVPDALAAVNHVLRDFRTGEVHTIEPRLLDLLTALSHRLGVTGSYSVISGYRSPQTNAMLHAESSQVASGSLHMKGQAIDIRMLGTDLTRVRDAALDLAIGGVGYYSDSNFVHVDIGRVRRWSGT